MAIENGPHIDGLWWFTSETWWSSMATFHGYGFQFPPFMGLQILRKKPFLHRVEIDEFDLRGYQSPRPQMNNRTLPLPPIAANSWASNTGPRTCVLAYHTMVETWEIHGRFMENNGWAWDITITITNYMQFEWLIVGPKIGYTRFIIPCMANEE